MSNQLLTPGLQRPLNPGQSSPLELFAGRTAQLLNTTLNKGGIESLRAANNIPPIGPGSEALGDAAAMLGRSAPKIMQATRRVQQDPLLTEVGANQPWAHNRAMRPFPGIKDRNLPAVPLPGQWELYCILRQSDWPGIDWSKAGNSSDAARTASIAGVATPIDMSGLFATDAQSPADNGSTALDSPYVPYGFGIMSARAVLAGDEVQIYHGVFGNRRADGVILANVAKVEQYKRMITVQGRTPRDLASFLSIEGTVQTSTNMAGAQPVLDGPGSDGGVQHGVNFDKPMNHTVYLGGRSDIYDLANGQGVMVGSRLYAIYTRTKLDRESIFTVSALEVDYRRTGDIQPGLILHTADTVYVPHIATVAVPPGADFPYAMRTYKVVIPGYTDLVTRIVYPAETIFCYDALVQDIGIVTHHKPIDAIGNFNYKKPAVALDFIEPGLPGGLYNAKSDLHQIATRGPIVATLAISLCPK